MLIAYRIDLLQDTIKDTIKDIIKGVTKGFYVIEKADKTGKLHIQGIGEFPDIKSNQCKEMKQYRDEFKLLLGDHYRHRGQQYSFTVCQSETKYIQYLLKQVRNKDTDIYSLTGYTDDDLIIDNTDTEQKKVSGKSIGEILLSYLDNHISYFITQSVVDERRLWLLVNQFFGENTKKFRPFILIEYFNLAKYKYVKRGLLIDMYEEARMQGIRFYKRDINTGDILYNPDIQENSIEEDIDDLENCVGQPKNISLDFI